MTNCYQCVNCSHNSLQLYFTQCRNISIYFNKMTFQFLLTRYYIAIITAHKQDIIAPDTECSVSGAEESVLYITQVEIKRM